MSIADRKNFEVTNVRGRKWDSEYDYRMYAGMLSREKGNFTVVTENGYPLFGCAGAPGESATWAVRGWFAHPLDGSIAAPRLPWLEEWPPLKPGTCDLW